MTYPGSWAACVALRLSAGADAVNEVYEARSSQNLTLRGTFTKVVIFPDIAGFHILVVQSSNYTNYFLLKLDYFKIKGW